MTEQQQNVIPIRSVDDLIRLAHEKWKQGDNAEDKVKSLRVETGRLLLELRERVEAGEVGELATWWEWYADNFVRCRSDAEKLMAMARAKDPEAAHEAAKARNRQHQQAWIDRQRQKPPLISGSGAEPTTSLSMMDGDLTVAETGFRKVVRAMSDPKAEVPEINRPKVEAWIEAYQSFTEIEKTFAVKRLKQCRD